MRYLILVILVSTNLWASRHVTMTEAQDLIKKESAFPIVMNESVLKQLNRYLGSKKNRSFMKASLQRKNTYAELLSQKAQQYGTPDELNAIPIIESGFVNVRRPRGRKPAGLWMFIPPTARQYGMRVNKTTDERLNVTKQTDGAHRYLLSYKKIYHDWHLALLAYNMGEGALNRAIKKYKTRDAWELLRKGTKADKNYLPNVLAAMIIVKNPELVHD